MSDTNTKTGNGSDGSSMMDFFNNNSFSRIMYNGPGGIPYAAIGMVTIAAGVFSYVTYVDYKKETEDNVAKEAEEEQSDGVFASVFGQDDTLAENKEPEVEESREEESDEKEQEDDDKEQESDEKEQESDEKEQENDDKKDEQEPGEKFKLGGKRYTKKRKSKHTRKRKTKNNRKYKNKYSNHRVKLID